MITVTPCDMPDVLLLERQKHCDERGAFAEFYKHGLDDALGVSFEQENFSISKPGVFRGLHYQLNPHAQAKLVTVVSGTVLDFALDIRRGSPWYGKYVMVRLDASSLQSLFIPAGFAHGFLALETAHVLYKTSVPYNAASERGIVWNDKSINLPIFSDPIVSAKDVAYPTLEFTENNFTYET